MKRPIYDKSLEERFLTFLSGRIGSQNIDNMDIPNEFKQLKRADFLINNKIVVEVKSLNSDPGYKIEQILGPHRKREEFPLYGGSLKDVLQALPDGANINKKLFFKVTKSVQHCFEKADKQIRDTKTIINNPDVAGVLALLNEEISVLEPKVIAHIIRYMMAKRKADGSCRYANIHFVYFVSEAHYSNIDVFTVGLPLMIIEGPEARQHEHAIKQFEKLNTEWAEFNNVPIYDKNKPTNKIPDGEFQAFGGFLGQNDQEAMQIKDLWRREYLEKPYLSHLSEEELLVEGRAIIQSLEPYYRKGFPVHSQPMKMELLARWAHFLQEGNLRGYDIENLKRDVSGLKFENRRNVS